MMLESTDMHGVRNFFREFLTEIEKKTRLIPHDPSSKRFVVLSSCCYSCLPLQSDRALCAHSNHDRAQDTHHIPSCHVPRLRRRGVGRFPLVSGELSSILSIVSRGEFC